MGENWHVGRTQNKIAILEILIAGTGWGCIGLFVRRFHILGLSSYEICAVRALITVCLLFIIIMIINKSYFRIKVTDLLLLSANGIISLTLFNICYFTTINSTSLSIAATLLYSSPAFVMIMSYFIFGERITWKKAIAIIMTIAGCVLVSGLVGDAGNLTQKGFLIGLCAGFCYALNSILSRIAINKGYESLTISFYTFLFGFIGLLPMIRIHTIQMAILPDPSSVMMAVIFAVLCTLMPYFLYTKGLSAIENSKAAVTAAIEPVVATLISVIVFHEELSLFEGVGVVLVIVAICLA